MGRDGRSPVMIPTRDCVTAAVGDLLRRQPLTRAKLAFAWRAAVGAAVERATTITLGADGTLSVRASDEHWRREVQRSAPLILARLAALLGAGIVRQIRVAA